MILSSTIYYLREKYFRFSQKKKKFKNGFSLLEGYYTLPLKESSRNFFDFFKCYLYILDLLMKIIETFKFNIKY